jgi:hypothetical protein
MRAWRTLCIIAVIISASLLILPASGGLFTIPQGGTAFIGEQGLDITQTGVASATRIGWFGNSTNVTADPPVATVTVDNAGNFFVDPAIFTSKTGAWYSLPSKSFAFYVQDPTLALRVYDDTANIDVTDSQRGITRGDQASFQIDTNLVAMLNRSGITMVPMTIYVLTPGGAQLAEISGHPLKNIGVSSSPYSTGPIWDTRQYSSGTYTVWAICNVNNMNDNYRADGKTQTPQTGNVLIQSGTSRITPSITPVATIVAGNTPTSSPAATTPSTAPTTTVATSTPPPTTLPTTIPATKSPGPGFILVCVGILGGALILKRRVSR